jgi:hypothetical protein
MSNLSAQSSSEGLMLEAGVSKTPPALGKEPDKLGTMIAVKYFVQPSNRGC